MARLTTKESNRRNYEAKKASGYFAKEIERLRTAVAQKLGTRCVQCGFSDFRALQIDHINNDGYLENRGRSSRRMLYRKVLKDDGSRYQLLCANCNTIKMVEHRKEKV